jgi:hypothetical protein
VRKLAGSNHPFAGVPASGVRVYNQDGSHIGDGEQLTKLVQMRRTSHETSSTVDGWQDTLPAGHHV